ncbi:MAG: reverse transcriptase domain-containing protein [Actinomycetota bacterium]
MRRAHLDVVLATPRQYRDQVDRLHRRFLLTSELFSLQQAGVPLARVVQKRRRIARLMAREVRRGTYRLEPGELRTIRVDGKEREVYWFRLTDLLVHGAVAALVEERMAAELSSSLYSYRPGVSWGQGISDLAAYVRRHVRERPDPRTRGLYVLRRDVDSYTDSIPVGERSPVWPMLERLLVPPGTRPPRPSTWALVRDVVRPTIRLDGTALGSRTHGVPTGQPISTALFNLYLTGFDAELDSVPGAFYGRYSDDIVFAHPDPHVVRGVSARMDEVLDGLGLRFNPAKRRDSYLTGAGRPSEAWPKASGTTHVSFLGTRVSGRGTVSLDRNKTKRLLLDLRHRARRAARSAGGDADARGALAASVINEVLHPRRVAFQQRSAAMIRRMVTDREQLRQLDHAIARIAIEAATGDRDIRAFRRIPYRRVREEWGLRSLLHERNQWGRVHAADPR